MKEATQAAIGYEVQDPYQMKDYGRNTTGFVGLPLFQPLLLKAGEPGVADLFLQSAVVNISRTKNIVQTVVQGRDTSVKEYINSGDWMITVDGIIFRMGWQYPLEEVVFFNEYMEKNLPLEVTHEILNALGINQVVVTDYTLTKTRHINCQAYSFNCVSDEPLPLMLSDLPNMTM